MSSDIRTEQDRPAWWKPWQWSRQLCGFVLLWLVLVTPLVVRSWCLSSVPDPGEPFDVTAFLHADDDIAPEDDGGEHYRRAHALRRQIDQELSLIWKEMYAANIDFDADWGEAHELLRRELELSRPALLEWKKGTEKRYGLITPMSETDWSTSYKVERELCQFARLAVREAGRRESEGDLAGAWEWYRAVYRSAGHLCRRRSLSLRPSAWSMYDAARDRVARWAENPTVTATQLRQARDDLTIAAAEIGPVSDMLKADYVENDNGLRRSNWPALLNRSYGTWWHEDRYMPAARVVLWGVGEPELSRRVLRQVLLNQLAEIDKPLHQRRGRSGTGRELLFDLLPDESRDPRRLDPAAIDRALKQSFVTSELVPVAMWQDRILRHRADDLMRDLCLTLQWFKRERGEFPESLEQLVPEYLAAVPLDPCDPAGQPVRYRREQNGQAVVWSIGTDLVDHEGDVGPSQSRRPPDIGFKLK